MTKTSIKPRPYLKLYVWQPEILRDYHESMLAVLACDERQARRIALDVVYPTPKITEQRRFYNGLHASQHRLYPTFAVYRRAMQTLVDPAREVLAQELAVNKPRVFSKPGGAYVRGGG